MCALLNIEYKMNRLGKDWNKVNFGVVWFKKQQQHRCGPMMAHGAYLSWTQSGRNYPAPHTCVLFFNPFWFFFFHETLPFMSTAVEPE